MAGIENAVRCPDSGDGLAPVVGAALLEFRCQEPYMSAALMSFDTISLAQRQIGVASRHTTVADAILRYMPLWVLKLHVLGTLKIGTLKLRMDAIMFRGLASAIAERLATDGVWKSAESKASQAASDLQSLGERVVRVHGEVMRLMVRQTDLQSALKEFAAAGAELYDSITGLRWQFLELEAGRSRIDTGYAAFSAEELDQVLNRVTSE